MTKICRRKSLASLALFQILMLVYPATMQGAQRCETVFKRRSTEIREAAPREIDAAATFDALVQWIHDDIIVRKKAPGLVVGVSGTDSIVAFLAAAKAFEKAGKPDRVAAVHYAPSEDFLDDVPEARAHLWFQERVMPWLKQQAPEAHIVVDTSIDFRRDGLRWGALMDWSVTENHQTRAMRTPDQRFWVVGTRNASEEALFSYSNASTAASVQVLTHLWKSEILLLSKYLGAPAIAIEKSCEVDCVCGRLRLPAQHIPEVDALLMNRAGLVSESYITRTIAPELRVRLMTYIQEQIASGDFKSRLPYRPTDAVVRLKQSEQFTRVNSRLTEYGRSFSQWRFLTQQRAEKKPSLAETFGMKRVKRSTDVRDANLAASDPNRDELGPTFVWQNSKVYIEYRRAYILISSRSAKEPGTLVIRNNSSYFGRDRLPYAVAFSAARLNKKDFEKLEASSFGGGNTFQELREDGDLDRVSALLFQLDKFNLRVSRWLTNEGRIQLADFLQQKLLSRTPVYLGEVAIGASSVAPVAVEKVDARVVQQAINGENAMLTRLRRHFVNRLVLLSGEMGDAP